MRFGRTIPLTNEVVPLLETKFLGSKSVNTQLVINSVV